MSDLIRPDFPHAIDSTIRAAFCSCPRKFYREYLQHWKPSAESVHLIAGGAFARGLEVARKLYWGEGIKDTNMVLAEATREIFREYGDFDCPPESAKSPIRLVEAMLDSFNHYGWATDPIQPFVTPQGKPAIEFKFALPLPINHPVTGDPLLYCGRFDMLGVFQDCMWVVDDKTSSSLGAQWIKQWDLRGQITGYCWAAREHGMDVAGGILRGVGILKTKITHAQSIQYRPASMIDKWHTQLVRDIQRMIDCWEEGYYDYNFADACTSYGGCPLVDVCKSLNEEKTLEAHYVQRKWDPLEIAKIKTEEAA